MYVLRARLDPEVGALLERALAAAVEKLYGRTEARDDLSADAAAGLEAVTVEQRRADAIGLVAECALRSGMSAVASAKGEQGSAGMVGRAERFQVVVHVDADASRESSAAGQSVLAGGVRVSAETSRRLACDAGRVADKWTQVRGWSAAVLKSAAGGALWPHAESADGSMADRRVLAPEIGMRRIYGRRVASLRRDRPPPSPPAGPFSGPTFPERSRPAGTRRPPHTRNLRVRYVDANWARSRHTLVAEGAHPVIFASCEGANVVRAVGFPAPRRQVRGHAGSPFLKPFP